VLRRREGERLHRLHSPNSYHSTSLAAGAIVAQGPPFSGFLNIFSADIRQNSLDWGDRPVAMALSTLEAAKCVTQHADVHANRHTSPRCTRRAIPFVPCCTARLWQHRQSQLLKCVMPAACSPSYITLQLWSVYCCRTLF